MLALILSLFIHPAYGDLASEQKKFNWSEVEVTALSDQKKKLLIKSIKSKNTKVIAIDFWASWCDVCIQSFPFWNNLNKDLKEQGLDVVGVSVDDSTAEVDNFMLKNPVSYSIFFDSDKSLRRKLNLKSLPVVYFVDSKGQELGIHYGFADSAPLEIRKKIELLLDNERSKQKRKKP